MSKSNSKILINAMDSEGLPSRISLKNAEKLQRRGRGHFEGDLFVFVRADYQSDSVAALIRGTAARGAGQQSPNS